MNTKSQARSEGPYVGPYPIQTGQPFFGRKQETAELVSRLVARRIVLLHSPSGAGKTSLIQAGLIPEMDHLEYLELPIIQFSQTPPPSELQSVEPNRFILSCLLSLNEKLPKDQRSKVKDLAIESIQPGFLAKYVTDFRNKFAEFINRANRKRTLMIFDQFEEILTIQPADHYSKEQFFNELMPVLDDNHIWVLFALREDFLARLDPYLGYFPERLNAHFQLDFLGLDAAREAIEEPVIPFGTTYSKEATDQLIHDLSLELVLDENNKWRERPGLYIEPVELQVVCERLWRADRVDPAQISLTDVKNFGKVVDALSGYYADSVQKAAEESMVPVRSIREWFQRALIAEGGIRQQVPQGSELEYGVTQDCAARLVDAYLVRIEEQRGNLWYRLAHDRLVEAAIRDNTRWNAENLSLLQRQALVWDREGRQDRFLLQGDDLVEAEQWLDGEHDPLDKTEEDLLDRSRELQNKKEAEAENERLNNLRIRRFLIAAISVAILALIGFFTAYVLWGEARTQRDTAETAQVNAELSNSTATSALVTSEYNRQKAEGNEAKAIRKSTEAVSEKNRAIAGEATATAALAEVGRLATQAVRDQARINEEEANALSQRLAFQSQRIINTDPDLAALLGIEAYKAGKTTEATNILLSSIYTSTVTIQQVHDPIGGFSSDIYSLAISPDEKFVAVGCGNGDVFLIDLQADSIQATALPYRHTSKVNGLSFSPDGSLLASSGNDSQLNIYNIETNDVQSHLLSDSSGGLSFRPDGLKLAVAEGFYYSIRDVTPGSNELSPPELNRRDPRSGYVHDVAYSHDGRRLGVSEQGPSGEDSKDFLTVFTVDSGGLQFIGDIHTQFIPALAWSPDERTIVTVSPDGRIIAWDTILRTNVNIPNAHENRSVYGVAVSYDGRYALTGGWDGYLRVWSLPDLQQLEQARNINLNTDILAVAISPRSYVFASAGTDRLVTIRRLVTQPSLAEEVTRENGQVRSMVVDSQGNLSWLYLDRRDGRYHHNDDELTSNVEKPSAIGTVSSVALDPNGYLALYARNTIYSVHGGYISGEWTVPEGFKNIEAMAFNQDGSQLATSYCGETDSGGNCQSNSIDLWDVESRTPRALIKKLDGVGRIHALAFSPDGKYIAAGTEKGMISIIDIKNGNPLRLNINPSPSEVLSLAYSRDGRILAGGNRAGDMLLWSATSGYQDLGRLNIGSSGALYSLAFDIDGLHLYTGGESGDIYKWVISPDLWIEIICQRVNRDLTPEEWHTFFFNDNYQPTCSSE